MPQSPHLLNWDPDAIQLKGFSRGVAEMQWLLIALALLYLLLSQKTSVYSDFPALAGTGVYFLISLGMGFLSAFRVSRRAEVALHAWLMIAFITWLLYAIDGLDSPLLSLYLLPVIATALALGRMATILVVGAVAACYLLLLYYLRGLSAFTGTEVAVVTANVVVFLLVGYLTTVLADAIHFANERLRVLALTDPLTGLYNRTILNTIIRPLFAGAVRDNRPLSVMNIDMDNLKLINDNHGHDAGDHAIVTFAQILKANLRESDIVARQGGDEFAAFLPNTTSSAAVTLAQRLLESTAATKIPEGDLMVSIGIAAYPEHGDTISELLTKADTAMYEVKHAGGRSVKVYAGPRGATEKGRTAVEARHETDGARIERSG